jgi:hypothetical protein
MPKTALTERKKYKIEKPFEKPILNLLPVANLLKVEDLRMPK